MRFLTTLFKLVLNTVLALACLPLLFLCAYGLMLGLSPTNSGFVNAYLPLIWSSFGIMGIIAFFATWFVKPKKILTVFIVCGIIAALPIVYISVQILINGAIKLHDLDFNLPDLLQLNSQARDEEHLQRSLVIGLILFSTILAPLLFVLKALYVLYDTYLNKPKTV